jgi:hypothetical protein
MDQATTETLKLRSELLAILRGPDADRRLKRWLLLRQTDDSVPKDPVPKDPAPSHGPMRPA